MKNKFFLSLISVCLLLFTNICLGQSQSSTPQGLSHYNQERSYYYRDNIVPVMHQVLLRMDQALSVEEKAQIKTIVKGVYGVKNQMERDSVEACIKPIAENHQELISEIQKELAERRKKWLADLAQIQLSNNEPPIPLTSTRMTDKMILENHARPWMLLICAESPREKAATHPRSNQFKSKPKK